MKKIINLFLSLLMCISMVTTIAFADTPVLWIEVESYPDGWLAVGDTFQIKAHVYPEDATNQGIRYVVDDDAKDIISVTDTGLVTALSDGLGSVFLYAAEDESIYNEVAFEVHEAGYTPPKTFYHLIIGYKGNEAYVTELVDIDGHFVARPKESKAGEGKFIELIPELKALATKVTVNGREITEDSFEVLPEDYPYNEIRYEIDYEALNALSEYDIIGPSQYYGFETQTCWDIGNESLQDVEGYFFDVEPYLNFVGTVSWYLNDKEVSPSYNVAYSEEDYYSHNYHLYLSPSEFEGVEEGSVTLRMETYDGYGELQFTYINYPAHEWDGPNYEFLGYSGKIDRCYAIAECDDFIIDETTYDITSEVIEETATGALVRYTAHFTCPVFDDVYVDVEETKFAYFKPQISDYWCYTTGIYVNHDEHPDAERYDIYRKSGSSWKKVDTDSQDEPFFGTGIDQTVGRTMGTKYTYRIRAYDADTKTYSAYSDPVTILFNPFRDVDPDKQTAFTAISWAFNKSIVNGTDYDEFSPEAGCTRGQLCIMLWKMLGKPSVSGKSPFTDIGDQTANTQKAIIWAAKKGIVKGYDDGTFRPDDDVTRAQMAIMLWRVAGKPKVSGTCPFTDIGELTENNKKAVIWAYQKGITKGTSDTTYGPDERCTREQLAIFLYRMNKIYKYVK